MRRVLWLIPGALILGWFLLQPGSALGHAALVRSDPPENSFLQRAPAEVSVTFSEPVDSRASSLQLLDARGQPLTTGALALLQDGLTLRVATPGLKPGIFNVVWSNVSSIDGHALRGSFPFTVLNPDGSLPAEVNTVVSLGTDADPPPLADGVAVRALGLLGLLLVAGSALFLLLYPESSSGLRLNLSRLTILGGGVLVIACALSLAVLRDVYSGLSLSELLLNTRGGGYLIARTGAALFVLAIAPFTVQASRRTAAATLGAVAVTAWALAATSHAAAGTGSAWGIGLDLVHRLAAVGWIGAVVGLLVAVRLSGRSDIYRRVLPRFSLLASVLVFVLLATGSLNAFIEIDRWGRFDTTRYGLTLLVKLGLGVALLAVAGYNARWGRRRLVAQGPREPRRFIFTAMVEVALGLLVFLGAATLTQTTVAKSVIETRTSPTFDQTTAAAGLNINLKVDPNRVGLNTYHIGLTDASSAAVDAQRVRLTFRYRDDQSVGPSTLPLAQTAPGTFAGQGPFLTLEGGWTIAVEVRRQDVDDTNVFFDVRPAGAFVDISRRGGAWDTPAPGLSGNQFGGLIALFVGLGATLWGHRLAGLRRELGWAANGLSITGFGVGALLLFGVHAHLSSPTGSVKLVNPIFPDQNSISTGRTLYQQNCIACHGQNGVPPKGLSLNPYPLDLTVHVPLHTDGELDTFIARGIPGSAMRAWSEGDGKLSTDQIWHVVNFLHTLTPVDR